MAAPSTSRAAAAALLAAAALALLAAAAAQDGDKGISKLKKTSSLFPHPRIGRSDYMNLGAGEVGEKRAAGLFQFPRVGRALVHGPLPFPLGVFSPLQLAPHQPADTAADLDDGNVSEQQQQPPPSALGHKRKGLVASARVGRRDGGEPAAPLWFGPRVGRSDLLGLGAAHAQEARAGTKRRGLLAFPRVGRSGSDGDRDRDRQGLWFGRRVGRRERRSLRLRLPAAAWLAAGDVGGTKGDFTPRLGRESGEDEAAVLLVGDGGAEGFDDADIDTEER
nr:CAPA transcript b [Locusta migratoria]